MSEVHVSTMRIAIDATPMLLRSSGVKNYVYYWIRSLQKLAGPQAVSAFPFLGPLGELNHAASTMSAAQTCLRLGYVIASNFIPLPILNPAARRFDIFHISSILVRHPPTNTRYTATLHDMTCWLMPEFHTRGNIKAAKEFGRVAQCAGGLIAVSEWTRQDAIRLLSLPPERIEVIYSGVADSFFHVDPAAVTRARATYSLSRPYVLFVGTVEPRKNLGRLLDAWQQLPPSLTSEFDLVLAGPQGWDRSGTVARARAMAGVRYLDYVPELDLPALTAGAAAFAYPSLYEGFGFPVAQAMAAGVPVLTSNVSSLPEIVGECGVLVDPQSVGEIGAGLKKLILSEPLRAQLGEQGRERAQRFRWAECARQSWAFFERVMGRA